MPRRLAFALALGLLLAPGSARADLTTGLIAFYPFDGNAQDASGNGNHGTPNGTTALTTDRFGAANSAYEFNGSDSRITVANSASLSSPTTQITQAAWVYMYGMSKVGSAFDPITMKSATGENALMYRFHTVENGIGVSYGDWGRGLLSAAPVPLNQWVFVASTYDGAYIRQYSGGTLADSVALNYTMVADTRPLLIGADTPGYLEVFWGKIDDLRIYNRALSKDEIGQLAAMTLGVDLATAPSALSFSSPRPNPSREGCAIELSLAAPGEAAVAVYDAAGRLVRTLARGHFAPGTRSIAWDGRDERGGASPAGLYFVRAQAGGDVRWSRVVRVR